MVPRDARSSRDPYEDVRSGAVPISCQISQGDIESFIALLCYETKIYDTLYSGFIYITF